MTAEQWIESARSLTQSSSVPLGVPIATHIDMLLRDTRRDLRAACDALEAVLDLHYPTCAKHSDEWPCDKHHPSCAAYCEVCFEDAPCPTVAKLTAALGAES